MIYEEKGQEDIYTTSTKHYTEN